MALFLALGMTVAGCERSLCVEEFKAEAECDGSSWDLAQERYAADACEATDTETDAYHHCMIACAEGGRCNPRSCRDSECLRYSAVE